MKTKLIAIAFGLVCLAAAPSIASAQYSDGVPTQWGSSPNAPATANDSWETGVAGARVRVQPNDAIESGRVAGQDPDPNIRTQLQREYNEGGDGD
jgi:hypothetical protein